MIRPLFVSGNMLLRTTVEVVVHMLNFSICSFIAMETKTDHLPLKSGQEHVTLTCIRVLSGIVM